MKRNRGQIVIGALVLLVILAILIPAVIVWMQNESKWTVKEQRSTRAFQLAEAAVERAYQQLIISSATWSNVQSGTIPSGYNFDQTYSDLAGGVYEVRISAGPDSQQATVTGIGKDSSSHEIRAVQAIYDNAASNSAIFAAGGVTLTSNPGVEWGPVNSPSTITTTQAHPRFYSSGSISLDSNGATPPNSDNTQWWSYYANLPPAPQVDTQSYYNTALAQGHVFAAGTYKMKTDICGGSSSCTGTYYFQGDTTLKTPSAYISSGTIVVMGDLTLQGSAGAGNYSATLPDNAWKEYGNDWSTYRTTYDPGAPDTFPGVTGSYSPGALTYTINNVLVHGFLYVQGSYSISGGGNSSIHGSMYLGDASSLDGSHVKLYYDDTVTVNTTNVSLARSSWMDWPGCSWSGTHPTCP